MRHPTFVQVDATKFGLTERDVPGGTKAIDAAVEALAAELDGRHRGLASREAEDVVRALGGVHAAWPQEMIRSSTRVSGRFRYNHAGSVGLADWDPSRLPTRELGGDQHQTSPSCR